MGPSDSHLGPPPAKRLRVSDSFTSVGLPCYESFCLCVPPNYPGESSGALAVILTPDAAAFPALASGRHS